MPEFLIHENEVISKEQLETEAEAREAQQMDEINRMAEIRAGERQANTHAKPGLIALLSWWF